ncbi:long-chain fatty acid--CoA ligase [bacterium]|nr:long-chain fatty acid--CoA ligase [bacterium]
MTATTQETGRAKPLERMGEHVVFPSIPAMFQSSVRESGQGELFFRKESGAWRAFTAEDVARDVRRLSCGLASIGVAKGDRVGIVAGTRLEWVLADLAILHQGAVTVGVYPTLLADDVAYQLSHSDAKVAFVEDETQLAKVLSVRAKLPSLERIVVLAGGPRTGPESALSLEDLGEKGEAWDRANPGAFERATLSVSSEDTATIIYTSGTTGPPKGAVLSHGNFCFVLASTSSVLPSRGEEELGVAFLPLAHALQRVSTYGCIYVRGRTAFAESTDKLMDNLRELRPTVQASVPRIWEKIHARIEAGLECASRGKRAAFRWAHEQGRLAAPYRKKGEALPLVLGLKWSLARSFFRKKVLPRLGLERVRFLSSGGAPIGVDLLEFFYAMDIQVIEGWGLTETAAPATINRADYFKFGSVGLPIPGTDVRIADDGEVLVRGPGVFKGYWKDETATRAAFDEAGYFKTGDIGAIDEDGFLSITDRKKNLIVTSLGKKIAPQNLENILKECPYLGTCLVHGDRRKFLSAIFTLDPEEIVPWARSRGILPPGGNGEAAAALGAHLPLLAAHADVRALVEKAVALANAKLAGYEQIKRWAVVGDRWTIEDGSLTPTLKIKRKVLEERYKAILDGFYESEDT